MSIEIQGQQKSRAAWQIGIGVPVLDGTTGCILAIDSNAALAQDTSFKYTSSTLQVPLLSLTSGYADITEVAAPANPAAGIIRLYAKANGTLAFVTSAGVERVINTTP